MRRFDGRSFGDLLTWVSASDLANITLVGGKVSACGRGLQAAQATAAQRPVLTAGGHLKGLPYFAAVGDGSGAFCELDYEANAFSSLTSGEMYMVVYKGANNGAAQGFGCMCGMPTTDYICGAFNTNHATSGFGRTVTADSGTVVPTAAGAYIWNAVAAPGDFRLYLNGTQILSTASGTVSFGGVFKLLAGVNFQNFFSGEFYELGIMSGVRTPTQRAGLTSALKAQYGVT